MAKAFPKSQFFGFDYHDKSIEAARVSAEREGIADRVTFEVAKSKEYPGRDYDFVTSFDCLHDMAIRLELQVTSDSHFAKTALG